MPLTPRGNLQVELISYEFKKKYLPDDPSTELTVQWSNICPAQKVRSSNVKYNSLVNITLLNIAQSALCHWLTMYATHKGYNLQTFSTNINSLIVLFIIKSLI